MSQSDQPAGNQLYAFEQSFRFTGTGSEFFRIWIVNLVLSIVTLGIYSAWAKVRTRRYFYGNTHWGRNAFEYLATPMMILKSRIIALILLLAYTLISQFSPQLAGGLFALLYLALPWVVYRSLRFNARMTRFRNIRFNFTGTVKRAVTVYLLIPVLMVFTFGLLYPKMKHAQLHYQIDNTHYGNLGIVNPSKLQAFYRVYFLVGLLYFLGFLVLGIGFDLYSEGVNSSQPILVIPGLLMLGLTMSWTIAFLKARLYQLSYHHTEIGQHQLATRITTFGLWRIYARYFLIMPLTLGLAWPWFRVALARYKAHTTTLITRSDLSELEDHSDQASSAIGEELGDLFDLGGI